MSRTKRKKPPKLRVGKGRGESNFWRLAKGVDDFYRNNEKTILLKACCFVLLVAK
jgi:hypothetical protein